MNCSLYWMLLLILLLNVAAKSNAAGCGVVSQPLRLRSTSNNLTTDETEQQIPQIDLSQLSEQQLQQLMQQLNVADQFDEDNRGSSCPWNKIQRIIRRQLIRIPKRYLKKLLRQFGLARSGSGSVRSGTIQLQPPTELQPESQPQSRLYYLIPLE
ncbi:uncharacterized protein LOC117786811 [Drosophila innubila]|uniref:uncharacterized protein LOC117786811 n=1 Tax=Drosophila innubila TaxID=198719 RepID=UPI00148B4DEC|nr:uncharacterized protein LOC117786811 [Drosophila innubila]